MRTVPIDGHHLTIENVVAVAHNTDKVCHLYLTDSAKESIRRSAAAVQNFSRETTAVYGVTTGFGAFRSKHIPSSQQQQLQVNILRSHAAGVGKPIN